MKYLNQLLSLESQIKGETDKGTTLLHRVCDKPELFEGHERIFKPEDDEGFVYPSEDKRVQYKAETVMKDSASLWAALFDFTLVKDEANSRSKADVVVGEKVILTEVPVTTLLFLEKQLDYVKKFVEKLPTLDGANEWQLDDITGYYKTDPIKTHKTKKVEEVVTLLPQTQWQQGKAEVRTKDILEGYWHTIKFSGAIPAPRKQEILERVGLLQKAVKTAREGANGTTAIEKIKVGEAIFSYLLHE